MRIFKIVFGFLLFVSVAIAAVIFALHYFISSDAIRIRLAQQLSIWTGYNVQLREAPKLNLYPYPRASLSGVVLTPNFDDASPLMEAERIEVDISIFDIIFGDISFSQTRIINPHFIMEEPIQTIADFFATVSRSNGALGLAVRDAQKLLQTNPSNFDSTQLQNQPFGRIIIENGELLYHKKDEKYAETIKGIDAIINWPASTKQLNFVAKANWHGALSELSIVAEQPITLLAGGESQIKASFNSLRGGISFEGRSRILQDYYFNGQISSLSPGLDQSIDWLLQNSDLNNSLAATLGKNIKSSVSFNANFTAQSKRIQFENLNLSVDHNNNNARGLLEINFQQSPPLVTGSVAFDRLDLDTIWASLSDDKNNNIVNFKDLDKIGLDARISVSELKLAKIAFTNIAAALQLRNGNASIDLGNAVGFGGNLRSTIEFKKVGEDEQSQMRISGTNIDIAALANSFGYQTNVNAKAGLTLNMQANIKNWSEIAKNMKGQLVINMLTGQINGYDFTNLPYNILTNQQFTLQKQGQSISNFDRFDIESKFTLNDFTITKANLAIGDWNVESSGKINKNLDENNYTLALESQLKMRQNKNETCPTVLCLQYNLQSPVKFNSSLNLNPNNTIEMIRIK